MRLHRWLVLWCTIASVFLVAPVVAGRVWTSRDGKYTVEAELVDVRDGKVILRRHDGPLIEVDLSRLSLGDVKYVRDALEAAGRQGAGESELPAEVVAQPTVAGPPLARPGGPAWQVTPDPPSIPATLPQDVEVAIRVPSRGSRALVLYPSAPSVFVATGCNERGHARHVWDLRTATMVGTIDAEIPGVGGERVALSPDAARLAVYSYASRGEIQVWSFATGQLERRLPLSSPTGSPCFFDFAGPDRLVSGNPVDQTYQVWNVRTGQVVATIPARPSYGAGKAISPGGTYFAVFSTIANQIKIFDTRNGVPAGDVGCRSSGSGGSLAPEALRFSPDGNELAGWFRVGLGRALLCWDMTTGKCVVDHDFPEDPTADLSSRPYRGPMLEWFPDGRGWLLRGIALLDRTAGQVIWVDRAAAEGQGPRRVIDGNRVLVVTGPPGQQVLRLVSIPDEEIAASRRVIDAGGTPADMGLPPITVADRSQAGTLMLAGRRVPWKYRAEPPAAEEDRLGPIAVPLGTAWHNIRGVFFASAGQARAVVPKHLGRSPAGWDSGTRLAEVCDLHDLRTGEQTGRFDVPFPTELIALSPQGDRGVFRIARIQDRLDVWDLASGQHVVGFRPYRDADRSSRAVTWAAMPDETHVLTLNRKSHLVCWELPECRAVYGGELSHQEKSALSPDRHVVVAFAAGQPHLLAATTGELLGTLANTESKEIMVFRAAQFSPDGHRLAMLFFLDEDRCFLAVWSLADGHLLPQLALPFPGFSLVWCGSGHVMIDPGGFQSPCPLVDVDRSLVVWRYQVGGGDHLWDTPDGRHWYLANQGPTGPATLYALRLPDAEAERLLATAAMPHPLLGPGGTAAVQVLLETADGTAEPPGTELQRLRGELEDHFTKALQRQGVRVVPQFPVRVVVVIREERIEGSIEVEDLAGRRGLVVLATSVVVPGVAVLDSDGTVVWGKKEVIDRAPVGPPGEKPAGMDATTFLRLQRWIAADRWLRRMEIPLPIFDPGANRGLGESVLSPNGARVIRQPAPKTETKQVRKA